VTPSPPYYLAFETSSACGEIALGQGQSVLQTITFSGPRKHASEFLPAIDALCQNANIKPAAIATVFVSIGPGSFTGLRIGVTAARFIAFATGASIVAVPTLDVIAQNALDATPVPKNVAVLLDAKRQHVFTATFIHQNGAYLPTCDAHEAPPETFLKQLDSSTAVLGEGVKYHEDAVRASGLPVLPEQSWPPRAATLYALGYAMSQQGEFTEFRKLVPHYIRPPEAEEKWQERFGTKTS